MQAPVLEAKDILLKRLARGLRGGFPAFLGLDLAPIVEALPAELPVLRVQTEQPDTLFGLEDAAIVQFEFQMKRNPDDLERFYRIQFAVAEHYQCPVHTVVLYGPDVLDAPDTLDRGSVVFRVRNLYIGAQDREAVMAMLRERLATSQPLSEAEGTRLKLLPLMRQRRPLAEVLREVALLARGAAPRRARGDPGHDGGAGLPLPRGGDGRAAAGGADHGKRIGESDRRYAGTRTHGGPHGGHARSCAILCVARSNAASARHPPRSINGSPLPMRAR